MLSWVSGWEPITSSDINARMLPQISPRNQDISNVIHIERQIPTWLEDRMERNNSPEANCVESASHIFMPNKYHDSTTQMLMPWGLGEFIDQFQVLFITLMPTLKQMPHRQSARHAGIPKKNTNQLIFKDLYV